MIDREKVIKGINYCTHTDEVECPNCPYWQDDDCVEALIADALALLKKQEEEIENLKQMAQSMMKGVCLLKEQEAVRPTWSCGKPYCGSCGLQIRGGKYCSECGAQIAWEGR